MLKLLNARETSGGTIEVEVQMSTERTSHSKMYTFPEGTTAEEVRVKVHADYQKIRDLEAYVTALSALVDIEDEGGVVD